MRCSAKALHLGQIGRRICAQESVFSRSSLISCKISEAHRYSEVRKYKIWEPSVRFIPQYDIANVKDQVQEAVWWLLMFQSY